MALYSAYNIMSALDRSTINDMANNLDYNIRAILSLILPADNLKLTTLGYPITPSINMNRPPLSLSVLEEGVVFCTGGSGSEGKGKRKASPEDDNAESSANKRAIPEGGVAGVSINANQNFALKKSEELRRQKEEAAKEHTSVVGDLKDVRQTVVADDQLSLDQWVVKKMAILDIKKKYPLFFDEDSGNATDKEGLDQVIDYLSEEEKSLNKKVTSLNSQIVKYESILS